MPVEVHDLKTMFFDYVKTGTNDPINKHYQSKIITMKFIFITNRNQMTILMRRMTCN